MPNTYTLIEKITVGAAGASSIEFTSIPQTYTDLKIVLSARANYASTISAIFIKINNDTAANYKRIRIFSDGSSVSSYTTGGTNDSNVAISAGANANSGTASTFSNFEFYIPNYTSSNQKSISIDGVAENNSTTAYAQLQASLWTGTSAITSLTITAEGNFNQYSTFYLYGIAKEGVSPSPSSAPYATGGDSIVFDGTYWIHTFTSTGTFTPKKNLTCDYLVVAGGGGGGKNWAGGAGAGGYRYVTAQSFTSNTNYTATVGGGGAGATTTTALNSGTNSSFNSTSATGGGAGGNNQASPASGGSGGGGAYTSEPGVSTNGAAGNAGSYSPVEGYAGGNGYNGSTRTSSAGGGGSSAVGANAVNDAAGAGGAGTSNSITGSAVTYAGGGGGGGYTPTGTYPAGAGGSGGGGAGGSGNGTVGGSGTANTGGGGGGGAGGSGNGGAGGSGIVIVRYAA